MAHSPITQKELDLPNGALQLLVDDVILIPTYSYFRGLGAHPAARS